MSTKNILLNNTFSFEIYAQATDLPNEWDRLANSNVFLSQKYLLALQDSTPENMTCHFVGIYRSKNLVGIALTQMISLSNVKSFGVNKSCVQSKIRDFVFKKFASNVLLIGNNMLTGQNAFIYDDSVTFQEFIASLNKAVCEIQKIFKNKGKNIHILNFKDFYKQESYLFQIDAFSDFYNFEIQPNMIFEISDHWNSIDDYVADLLKKYRDQFKRSHKKAVGIVKKKLSLDEIALHSNKLHALYLNVTNNAPFNTFYLAENHFFTLKKKLGSDFLLYAYFIDNEIIGFNTLIKNGTALETYFLGYNDVFQREKMLYLNMLYDMIAYGIHKKFKTIIFARTALEIKSSVGAKPHRMFGYIKHSNKVINFFMPKLFKYFEPHVSWHERNVFATKDIHPKP